MAQSVFNDIDPNTESGTQLATDLNNFKLSLLTGHSGASQPTYIETGTEWLDSSTAGSLIKKFYDGTQDISVFTVDTAAHTISYGGNNATAAFSISRTDTSANMLELFRNTQTQTNGGIVFTQRNDADVKKTMARMAMVSDSIVNGAEEAAIEADVMIAGSLVNIFRLSDTAMFAKFLEGTGKRYLTTDANGNVSSEALQSGGDAYGNGNADTGDETLFTTTGSMTVVKSTTSTELITGDSVYKCVSSAGSEILSTGLVNAKNGFKNNIMIFALEYSCATDWTMTVEDDAANVLATETLRAFVPIGNEANNKKMFAIIPNAATSIRVRLTSSAADTLLFDNLEFLPILSEDQDLYFERDIANNQTNTDLFEIGLLKNKAYKVEARIYRDTDTNYAESLVEFFLSYSESTSTWRVAKETVTELESVETEVDFNMNSNTLRYSSSDITGANYVGKINGKIKRIL